MKIQTVDRYYQKEGENINLGWGNKLWISVTVNKECANERYFKTVVYSTYK